MHNLTAEHQTLFIAHNGGDVVRYGQVEAGKRISTGQPNLETFGAGDRSAWLDRLEKLGVSRDKAERQGVAVPDQSFAPAVPGFSASPLNR